MMILLSNSYTNISLHTEPAELSRFSYDIYLAPNVTAMHVTAWFLPGNCFEYPVMSRNSFFSHWVDVHQGGKNSLQPKDLIRQEFLLLQIEVNRLGHIKATYATQCNSQ